MRSQIKITRMKVMDTDQYQQAVVHVEWAKAAIDDDGTKAAVFLASDFDPEKITGNFVPFGNLTEEIVLGWVMQSYENEKEKIDEALRRELEKQRKANTEKIVNLPWVSNN